MNYYLQPFDKNTHGFSVQVDAHFRQDEAFLEYTIKGPLAELLVPLTAEGRGFDLWKQSCVELFIHPQGGMSYREYNFSLSGAWDAFDFTAYRQGLPASITDEPEILIRTSSHALRLSVVLPRAVIENHPCNVTAILQLQSGERTFWAVSHSGTQPDFHAVEDCLCLFQDSTPALPQEDYQLAQLLHTLQDCNNA